MVISTDWPITPGELHTFYNLCKTLDIFTYMSLQTCSHLDCEVAKKTGTNAMVTKIVEPFIQYSGDPMCERVAEWHMQIIHSASNSGEEGLAWRHLHL